MKFIVFGSEGMGGKGIIREIEHIYPDAMIIKIDKKLGNDYDEKTHVTTWLYHNYKCIAEDKIYLIPLNTSKLYRFADTIINTNCKDDIGINKPIMGYGKIDYTEWLEKQAWDVMYENGFEANIPKAMTTNTLDKKYIHGILAPLFGEKEDRVCMKRKGGFGGRGFYVLTKNKDSFKEDIGKKKSGKERWHYEDFPVHRLKPQEWYFQEYCNGWLISVDVLYHKGNIQSILMRKRMESIDGKTTVAKRTFIDELYLICEMLGKEMSLDGIHGFQFKHAQSKDDKLKLIDWNPRFQSGIAFGRYLGEDILTKTMEYFIEKEIWETEKEMEKISYYDWLNKTHGKITAERDMGNIVEKKI